MDIVGSSIFFDKVTRALYILSTRDPDYDALQPNISSITEVPGTEFIAEIDSNYGMRLSTYVASWPGADDSLQVSILATYIAHEMIHAYLRRCGSTEWNHGSGEELAYAYQKRIASALAIPEKYVTQPHATVPKPKVQSGDRTHWVVVLALLAVGAVVIKGVR